MSDTPRPADGHDPDPTGGKRHPAAVNGFEPDGDYVYREFMAAFGEDVDPDRSDDPERPEPPPADPGALVDENGNRRDVPNYDTLMGAFQTVDDADPGQDAGQGGQASPSPSPGASSHPSNPTSSPTST